MLKDLINFSKLFFIKKNLIIFCETNNYSCYFSELIDQLQKKNVAFTYLCQEGDVNIKRYGIKEYLSFKNVILLSHAISFISCKRLILTTPDFGNTIKISKKCEEFIYLFHSFVSSNLVYKEKAFDSYNVILCVGPHHYKEFKSRHIKKKQKLLKVGYPYLDTLLKKHIKNKIEASPNRVLIAPTWSPTDKNYYDNYDQLIQLLLKKNFEVILRPHPEFFKRFFRQIANIEKKFSFSKNFYLDQSADNFDSLSKSKFLITDWSGIAFEFAFVFKRPVIFFDVKQKILNTDLKNSNYSAIEETIRDEIGIILEKKQIQNIELYLQRLEINKELYYKNIIQSIKKNVYNFGSSASVIIKYLVD